MASRHPWPAFGRGISVRSRRIGIATGLLLVAGAVHAYVPSKAVGDLYEQRLQAFVGAQGFVAQPEDRLERALPQRACSVCPADRGLQMLTWPLLRIDAAEGYLPSARYLAKVWYVPIRAGDSEDQMTLTLVEVSRFNHGARISNELRRDYGEDARGPLKTDVAPHVQWRFGVMQVPQTNGFTDVLSPSRRILDGREAARSKCLGSACLALAYDAKGEPVAPVAGGVWRDMGAEANAFSATSLFSRHRAKQSLADPPGPLLDIDAISEALQQAGALLVDGEGRGTASDRPDAIMQIDYLLDGQDTMTTGMLCWLDAADDSVKDVCTRISAVADGSPHWDQYVVPRKRGN